ncbi:MAG: hypothetical protein LBJ74_02785 [Heliobacteriaceae bacterium]|jgi:hypothetical protein|nr:hypothetical protein [Heliobacteriaceae bacterium]
MIAYSDFDTQPVVDMFKDKIKRLVLISFQEDYDFETGIKNTVEFELKKN